MLRHLPVAPDGCPVFVTRTVTDMRPSPPDRLPSVVAGDPGGSRFPAYDRTSGPERQGTVTSTSADGTLSLRRADRSTAVTV